MLPGDRLICAFVQPQKAGTRFTDWFLHVTIVAWFRLDESSEQICMGLQKALTVIKPFEAKAGVMVKFGPKKNRPARLLELPAPITEVEQKVRAYFHKKRAWLVDETTKRHYNYRPHVTMQKAGELHDGETFQVNRLYIVEQKGDYKVVVSTINLSA